MIKRGLSAGFLLVLLLLLMPRVLASPFDDDGILRVVNRESKITKKYVPEGMVLPDVETNKKSQKTKIQMTPEAAAALEDMFVAAKEEKGYHLLAVSGYRSYGEQQLLFKNKVDAVGSQEAAWRKVAPAGASEHQLGLAMDVVCDTFRNLNSGFANTDEGKWLYANCHRFGFIVRYLKEWESVTGYAAEPWHFRYIGVSHACAVQWLNIPYETYALKAVELPVYFLENANAYLLYGVMNDALNGDGRYFEEICDSAPDWETIAEMTEEFLPDGITLEMALNNEGIAYAFTQR